MTPLTTAFAVALVLFIIVAGYLYYLSQRNYANSFYLVNPANANVESEPKSGGSGMIFVGYPSGPKSKVPLAKLVGKNATVNTKSCGILKGKVVSAFLSDGKVEPKLVPKNSIVVGIQLKCKKTPTYVFDASDCVTVIV